MDRLDPRTEGLSGKNAALAADTASPHPSSIRDRFLSSPPVRENSISPAHRGPLFLPGPRHFRIGAGNSHHGPGGQDSRKGIVARDFTITLPLARRSLLSGLALSSARALGEFGFSLMIAGNIPGLTQTQPLYIFSRVETLNFAQAYGAALLLALAGFSSLYAVPMLEEGRGTVLPIL